MLYAIFLLFSCNLLGEALVRGAKIPIPGPVLGLVILALGLIIDRRLRSASATDLNSNTIGKTADNLLGVLGLLLVPAGVGIVEKVEVFHRYGLGLAIAIAGSVIATLVCAVFSFLLTERLVLLLRRKDRVVE